jgi:hypothetical protein
MYKPHLLFVAGIRIVSVVTVLSPQGFVRVHNPCFNEDLLLLTGAKCIRFDYRFVLLLLSVYAYTYDDH